MFCLFRITRRLFLWVPNTERTVKWFSNFRIFFLFSTLPSCIFNTVQNVPNLPTSPFRNMLLSKFLKQNLKLIVETGSIFHRMCKVFSSLWNLQEKWIEQQKVNQIHVRIFFIPSNFFICNHRLFAPSLFAVWVSSARKLASGISHEVSYTFWNIWWKTYWNIIFSGHFSTFKHFQVFTLK